MVMIYRNGEYHICEITEADEFIKVHGFTEIPDAKYRGKEFVKCQRPILKTITPKKPDARPIKEKSEGISGLSWNDLRAYGKELEIEFDVELPLKSKREEIEKAINKLLEG